MPDLLVVATDSNCKGYVQAREEIRAAGGDDAGSVVYAIPDPHIERWLLIDSAAFKAVFGRGCSPPDQKCDRLRYKRLLFDAVRATGIDLPLGGIERTSDLVDALDLARVERADASLGKLLQALHD